MLKISTNSLHGPALPDDTTVHLVLDLALKIGEVQMSSGAGAADVTATILSVTESYGLPHTEVDVIYTSISVSCHRGTEALPITSIRVVRQRSLDYTRLADVEHLVRNLGPIEEAHARLEDITNAKHPYPRWVATAAWGGMAAAVAFLVGGGLVLALTAAAITAVVDRVGRILNRRNLPFFFQQLVGGALGTGAALAIFSTGLLPVRPSLLVAVGIVVLLSGLALVSTVQDAISGYNVTAAGRTVETVLLSAGLIAGVALAIRAAVHFGLDIRLSDPLPALISAVPMQFAAGAATSAFFALACYARPRALVAAAISGAIGTAAYGLMTSFGLDALLGSAVAAAITGFGGATMTRRLRIPTLVVVQAGVVPLLPGWTTYRGLFQLTAEGDPAGLSTLVFASGIALALAGGVVFGEYLAQPVRTGLGRLERKFAGPRMSGPLKPSKRRLE
ncbi:threonine/serine exporter family protein [Lentzea sp. NBC_00516]|uniref:Threonine/serine exporter family protein n=1 Tax=Lentzea sokolovensis TaxID=3095429 RepID=A0ABU4UW05_9PSEU|nr:MULTISPECIES: threonine/serine exporter family protein [unclassified Lentzea]MDX8143682.1 threonine/serine exporter family protein [Lentzea sp. BCCO 10_0061]WUD22398.1 threonine/serine exporter family protein [Lentzea sp. NBC_00516]